MFLIKIVLFLLIYHVFRNTIPPHYFILKETLTNYGIGGNFVFLGNHDGAHYLSIAKNGYNTYEQAFFPFFPLILHWIGWFSGSNFLLVGVVFNIVCALLSVSPLEKLSQQFFPKKVVENTSRWWLAFPTAFFFFVVYNESFFFLMTLLYISSIYEEKPLHAAFFGILAASTRLVGVFLIVIAFLFLWRKRQGIWQFIFAMSGPLIGLFAYMAYLWKTVGDPLFFFSAQPSFGANRSTHLILLPQVIFRYIKIFFTANHDFIYWIAVLEMGALLVGALTLYHYFSYLRKSPNSANKNIMVLIGLFGFLSLLLPTLTGTLSSLPRYLLTSPITYWGLALIRDRKQSLFIVFSLIAQFLLFALFSSGYFIS